MKNKLGLCVALLLLWQGVGLCASFVSPPAGGGGSFPGITCDPTTHSCTMTGLWKVNNTSAVLGDTDLRIKLDPNHDSSIVLETGNTAYDWSFQADSDVATGVDNFSEFELVSKTWEPWICWGHNAGSFYDGTCGYQQPINGDAPFHLFRATDTNPTGLMIDVEDFSGNAVWGVDATGAEKPLVANLASLPGGASCTSALNNHTAVVLDAANAAGCSTIGAAPTTGGTTPCGVICKFGAGGYVHY